MARFVKFPGTAGSYASTDDVNQYDADTAHLQQSVGVWVGRTSADPIQSQVLTPVFGTFHGQWTAESSTSSGIEQPTQVFPVVPTQTYTVSVWLASDTPGVDISVRGMWYSAADAFLGELAPLDTVSTTGDWQQGTQTGVAPATAAFLRVRLYTPDAGDAGTVCYFDASLMAVGSGATFVPSLRIVGDLDWRVDSAIADVTPSTNQAFMGNQDTTGVDTGGYFLQIVGGNLRVVWSDSGGGVHTPASSVTVASLGVVDAQRYQYRASVQMDNGAAGNDTKFYSRSDGSLSDAGWAQMGATVTVAGATDVGYGGGNSAELVVGRYRNNASGSEIAADIFAAQLHDGIDGPIVAQFNADDIAIP